MKMDRNKKLMIMVLLTIIISSCKQAAKQRQPVTKIEDSDKIFPQGSKITNDNFTGTAYLHQMIVADSLNRTQVGNVTFEPGARTKWHLHPGGQILLATGGVGYYQEKGRPKVILRKGDVIKCPANIPHWHGASVDTAFVQVAITNTRNGPTQWLGTVTDEEYGKVRSGLATIYFNQ